LAWWWGGFVRYVRFDEKLEKIWRFLEKIWRFLKKPCEASQEFLEF
jgi:hypothetical protein